VFNAPIQNAKEVQSKPGLKESHRAALAVAALALYLQATEWINLYPWNDIRAGNGQEQTDIIIALVTAGLVAALWWGGRIAALLATALMGIWGWLQVSSWWIPYIAGATPQWKRIYAKWFAGGVHILPKTENHLPPDANHLVLHILILIAFVLSLAALVASFRRRNAPA